MLIVPYVIAFVKHYFYRYSLLIFSALSIIVSGNPVKAIEIPLPVGKNQTQHGSAWWLDKSKFSENFGVNTIDPENETIKELLDKKSTKQVEPIFSKGGLTVGKKDRYKYSIVFRKSKIKIPYFKISRRKVEDIYFIKDNLHSLTIGATRSGKTRSVVLESINNIALAGENMIVSDPKRGTVSIHLQRIREIRL